MRLTVSQQQAIAARGNVLVMAGAGTGKTRTLVERCLDCLIHERPRASLEEILLVTFTEAAAAEMRQRIRARLEEERLRDPGDTHWQEQAALFETAHIGTIHSFCFELVRSHFYELELDPQLAVTPEEEARLLAEETLDQVLRAHYAGTGPTAESVQQLIQLQAKGSDQPVRSLVLRLHRYTQALPNPAGWVRTQLAAFDHPEPAQWREWLKEALVDWCQRAHSQLARMGVDNELAEECKRALAGMPGGFSLTQAESVLSAILSVETDCPNGKKKHWKKPLEDFFEECRFLASLVAKTGAPDPLQQDWDWVRGQMTTLLKLATEFGAAFTEAKRELGVLDFQDLEQYALRLLWDTETMKPTRVAHQWRQQLRFIFVDEYQDINAAQDCIIQALSREGTAANRFLVGDVKQSIYRFRLANPHIFQGYIESWRHSGGRVLTLQENFRSRKGILEFVNSVAEHLMHRELGGIEYDQEARLHFGQKEKPAPSEPIPCREPTLEGSAPAVEIQLRIKGNGLEENGGTENTESMAELADLDEAAKEARAVGLRLLALKAARHPVSDEQQSRFRPVDWKDIAILLRAPSRKAEAYAKEFARLQIPLQVARGGFYQSLEIADLLSLLQVLDNPLQDLPLLAVLRSPLAGLTLEELAEIRLPARHASFWSALVRWHNNHRSASKSAENTPAELPAPGTSDLDGALMGKVTLFLDRVGRWRRLGRQMALSGCLETILSETGYADWVATQQRGEQRCANIKRLVLVAQRFDQLQRQGLFRFLRFIEAQRRAETEPELSAVAAENAVRLMSIHQSKGLEFPVVVLADIGKPFNESDFRAAIILDEQYGLCPQIKPPHTGRRYPSLPHWLAARHQRRELLGEELRLLYVAMTRAQELLIINGSVSQTSYDGIWATPRSSNRPALDQAGSIADWLGAWFSANVSAAFPREGENALVRWCIQDDRSLIAASGDAAPVPEVAPSASRVDAQVWPELQQRFARSYPYTTSTRLPAKTSVSVLRRRALADRDEPRWGTVWDIPGPLARPAAKGKASAAVEAADIGTAHHRFLELVDLEQTASEGQLRKEAERLVRQGSFGEADLSLLDFNAIAAFWNSELGCRITEKAAFLKRELPFTFRLPAAELASLVREPPEAVAPDDFVVVQGIADLVVLVPTEIWVVDFKTDRLGSEQQMQAKGYEQQLRLYARGLSQIFQRPVTEAWLHYLALNQSVPVKLDCL